MHVVVGDGERSSAAQVADADQPAFLVFVDDADRAEIDAPPPVEHVLGARPVLGAGVEGVVVADDLRHRLTVIGRERPEREGHDGASSSSASGSG
jgi:hypothetical protein